jgi:xanthine dehydrogenase accessory factor
MRDWIGALTTLAQAGAPAVLVTVVAARGSVPRAPGTRMVVSADAMHGTIGGGHLEFTALAIARDLLASRGAAALHRFPLGASLGQCCGGVAQLLFEPVYGRTCWLEALARAHSQHADCALVTPLRGDGSDDRLVVTADAAAGSLGSTARDEAAVAFARSALERRAEPGLCKLGEPDALVCFVDVLRPPDLCVVLFGAGHVGRALVRVLAEVRCRITWVDTRDAAFPSDVAGHVECVATDVPEAEVEAAPAGACFLVMTHSHAQDEALAERILARDDFAYFGLIGSASKRRQFEQRLAARGTERARLARMTCPIGVTGIGGKEPGAIAIAVAAEVLQVHGRPMAARSADRHEHRA